MRVIFCLCIAIQLCLSVIGQTHFGVMAYNCENAFDTLHDVGFDDYEFLPDGKRTWKRWKFYDKIRNIARVILATDSIQPVDIISLSEIENDTVMSYLTKRTFLARLGYKYVTTNSGDSRGLDVAVMYMPYTFRMFESQTIRTINNENTRDILRVSGKLITGDTLDVFALHLPSKLGGRKAERVRANIVRDMRICIDSLFGVRHTPNIIVLGDFNSEARTNLISKILGVKDFCADDEKVEQNKLYLMANKPSNGYGTYKYKGVWNNIDHIFISGAMLNSDNSISTIPSWYKVIDLPFLLEDDTADRSLKPKRSFLGPFYRGGFSDHLPVYMKFKYTIDDKE